MSHLCVFCSSQHLIFSSSSMSSSLDSKAPLNGITSAPGSWASTHSLIFASLGWTNIKVTYSECLTMSRSSLEGKKKQSLPLVLFPDVIFLWEINKVDHGLGCQEQVLVQHVNLWREFQTIQIMKLSFQSFFLPRATDPLNTSCSSWFQLWLNVVTLIIIAEVNAWLGRH